MARLSSGSSNVRIQQVAEPTATNDAATKNYVDNIFARTGGETSIADGDLVTFLDSSDSNAPSRITFANFKSGLQVQDEFPTAYAPSINVTSGVWSVGANRNTSTRDRIVTDTGGLSGLDLGSWGRLGFAFGGSTLTTFAVTTPLPWHTFITGSNTGNSRVAWNFQSAAADELAIVTAMNDSTDDNRYMAAWADANNWCVWKLTGTTTFFTAEASNGFTTTSANIDFSEWIIASAGEAQNVMAWTLFHTNTNAHSSWPFRIPDEGDRLVLANGEGDHVFWKKLFLDIDLQISATDTTIADNDLLAFVDVSEGGRPTNKITVSDFTTHLNDTFQINIPEPYVPNYTTAWPNAVSNEESIDASTGTTRATLNEGEWGVYTAAGSGSFTNVASAVSWANLITGANGGRIGWYFDYTPDNTNIAKSAAHVADMNDTNDNFRFLVAYIDSDNWCVWHIEGGQHFNITDTATIVTDANVNFSDDILAYAGSVASNASIAWAMFYDGTSATSTGTPLRIATQADNLVLDHGEDSNRNWRKLVVSGADLNYSGTRSDTNNHLTINSSGGLELAAGGGTTVTANPTGATTDTLHAVTIGSTNYNIVTVNQTATQVRLDGSQATPETGYQIEEFNATRAGVVGAANDIKPNWLTMQLATTVKSEVLSYQGTGAINNLGRRYQRYAGTNASPGVLSLVSTAPTSWEDFRGPTYSTTWDDTIRVDDEGGTYSDTVLTNMRASTTDQTIVLVTDQNNWCILTMNADSTGGCYYNTAGDDPVLSIQNDRTSTGLVRPTIVNSQGSPGSTIQFFFPWSTSTNAEITNLTGAVDEDDLLSVDGTFRTHHSHDLTNPAQLFNLFDMSYPTNIDRDSSGNVIRLRKYIFYGDYGAQYTATFDRNAGGQVTQINLFHGDFDATETPSAVHRLARKVITRNVANTQVISVPILAN